MLMVGRLGREMLRFCRKTPTQVELLAGRNRDDYLAISRHIVRPRMLVGATSIVKPVRRASANSIWTLVCPA